MLRTKGGWWQGPSGFVTQDECQSGGGTCHENDAGLAKPGSVQVNVLSWACHLCHTLPGELVLNLSFNP